MPALPPIPAPPFRQQMERHMMEMRKALDVAECLCPNHQRARLGEACGNVYCPAWNREIEDEFCILPTLRKILGDHVFPGDPVPEPEHNKGERK